MANNKILLKKSNVENKKPVDLDYGEIALNYHDGNIYYKNSNNVMSEIKRLDERLNATDVSNMIYDTNEDLIEVEYITGNKILFNYTNGDLTSADYYATDGTTHLYTQTLTYDTNGNITGSSWSII